MTIYWPAAFPQRPLASSYGPDVDPDNLIAYPADQGDDQVRVRSSRATAMLGVTYRLTAAQKLELRAFCATTLKQRSLRFMLPSPDTGAYVEVRLAEPASYTPVAAGLYWDVTLVLKVFS